MKTIITLILMLGISFCSHAQNSRLYELQKGKAEIFEISPKFKNDSNSLNFKFSQKIPDIKLRLNPPELLLSSNNFTKYELRMPVFGEGNISNMPIAIPDSTVHFFIKEKRIQFVNPLDKK